MKKLFLLSLIFIAHSLLNAQVDQYLTNDKLDTVAIVSWEFEKSKAGGMATVTNEMTIALPEHITDMKVINIAPFIKRTMEPLVKQGYSQTKDINGKPLVLKSYYNGKNYDVIVWEKNKNKGKIYLYECEKAWTNIFGDANDVKQTSPYFVTDKVKKRETKKLSEGKYNSTTAIPLTQERAIVVFSNALLIHAKKMKEMKKKDPNFLLPNIFVLNDYHAGLAAVLAKIAGPLVKWFPSTIMGHNLSYQGVLALLVKNKRGKVLSYEQSLRNLAKRLGISYKKTQLLKDLLSYKSKNYRGAFNITKVSLLLKIAIDAVSPEYAMALLNDNYDNRVKAIEAFYKKKGIVLPKGYWEHENILKRLLDSYKTLGINTDYTEKGLSKNESDKRKALYEQIKKEASLYLPQNGLDFRSKKGHARLGGVYNGIGGLNDGTKTGLDIEQALSLTKDKGQKTLLEKWGSQATIDALQNIKTNGVLINGKKAHTLTYEYINGNPKTALTSAKDIIAKKEIIRDIALKLAFPNEPAMWKTDKFIHFTQGRLTYQKDFPAIAHEAKILANRGDIYVIQSPKGDDPIARALRDALARISKKTYKNGGRIVYIDQGDYHKGELTKTAAMLNHFLSIFEPCGLTELEALRHFSSVLVNGVEGFGKTKGAGLIYKFLDSTNPEYKGKFFADIATKQKASIIEMWKNPELLVPFLNSIRKLDFTYKKAVKEFHKRWEVEIALYKVQQAFADMRKNNLGGLIGLRTTLRKKRNLHKVELAKIKAFIDALPKEVQIEIAREVSLNPGILVGNKYRAYNPFNLFHHSKLNLRNMENFVVSSIKPCVGYRVDKFVGGVAGLFGFYATD